MASHVLFESASGYAVFEVKLRAELEEAMPDSMSIPDISVLQSLPYLNAFIKEGENGRLLLLPPSC